MNAHPAATPGSVALSAAAGVNGDLTDVPPADIQAAYVAQYMATVARLAAVQSSAAEQKKPDVKGAYACMCARDTAGVNA